ncbi:nucleoside recognition domain-containing protein [Alicyclobacillus tolerans]|uniref:Spore maturation protein A n=2 Tax=Alicyclobacillus tolerans TaxID=90970 RepID=A0ABT9LWM9_9BACL|nr:MULTISPECIES: nucleoside recognition domain-containing protein [Alicyclobacillus]MDP9728670.1 spore maturation protein A [Alicyclobacillus tengchongensis]QRF23304.1 spore maturation protein [Alicyclobacillus sp. TC]SHK42312.1 spore maturation protein A [Alicyclobacillus montanus]
MIDFIWLLLFLVGIGTALLTGKMPAVSSAILTGAEHGVELCFGLISVIVLWMGLMHIAEKAGAITFLSRLMRPVAKKIFPSVPSDHPAMGAILANMSANILGIGNAATPLGLRAMKELQDLNTKKDTASDAMCTLLAVNTASITLIPTTVIAIRMQLHAQHPTSVIGPTLLATFIGTIAALIFDKIFRSWSRRSGRWV